MTSSDTETGSGQNAPAAPVGGGLFETAADTEATAKAAAAAAPVRVERADLAMVNSLDPALRPPVYALLSSLGDNKYLLGRRYGEWCTGAPMLESAVTAAAMAQDELGHARSFYPLLRSFPQAREEHTMEEHGWQEKHTDAVACLDKKFVTWADFIAVNAVVDSAFTALLSAAADSSYEPLRQRARKIVQEESGHFVHAENWLRRLLNAPEKAPTVARSLQAVWDDAFTWFGKADDPVIAPLVKAGLLAQDSDALRGRLSQRLARVVEMTRSSTGTDLSSRPLPWDRWDPSARRLRPAA